MSSDFSGSSMLGSFGAAMGVIWLISMVMCVIMIVSQWKIFKKAGEPGVAAIVPFWNTAVLFKITWGQWYYMFLMLIPCVGIIFSFMTLFKLSKVFGKSTGFGFGLIFLSVIFLPMLAFGSAEYIGIDGQAASSNHNVSDSAKNDADEDEDEDSTESSILTDTNDAMFDQGLEREQIPQKSSSNNKSHGAGRHWSV